MRSTRDIALAKRGSERVTQHVTRFPIRKGERGGGVFCEWSLELMPGEMARKAATAARGVQASDPHCRLSPNSLKGLDEPEERVSLHHASAAIYMPQHVVLVRVTSLKHRVNNTEPVLKVKSINNHFVALSCVKVVPRALK